MCSLGMRAKPSLTSRSTESLLRRRLLSDPNGLDYDDIEHSESELRSVRIGFSPIGRIVFVVYTRRVKYDQETIRNISARQATRKERAAYAG